MNRRVLREFSRGLSIAVALSSTGCLLSVPALKHETGETVGAGHFRFFGQLETAQTFPVYPTDSSVAGVSQLSSVFQGTLMGMQAAVGVHKKVELQLGSFLSLRGGGWKLGAKYQILGHPTMDQGKIADRGNFAVSVAVRYETHAVAGTLTYQTATAPLDMDQTLSGTATEYSVPVSFRLSPNFAVYSGLSLTHSSVSGSVGTGYAQDSTNDFSTRLGVKVNFDRFEGDIETAVVALHDNFSDSARLVPYYGISFGVLF